ncbi:hypothetical protein [Streptomyces sp. NBC_00996]|uniref:hypothetical protein n=1 Tax=Streptomyces sp. NBC_00996 TaxID=2903710 RepID=UPI00386CB7BF|nr:hypothetical protein OG390_20190 [Streptomyces sp. NBC_00996]
MGPGASAAVYDEHADWYNDFMSTGTAGAYIERVHAAIEELSKVARVLRPGGRS